MSHIAFFNYPAHGHVNPTLPVVTELVNRGHRVTYTVASHFADVVAATGADVVAYESLVPKSWNTVAIPTRITGDDLAEAGIAHLNEGIAPLDTIAARLEADRPDLIVYDSFGHLAGRLLSRIWDIPAVMTATTFVSSDTFSPYAKLAGTIDPPDPDHPALRRYAETLRATLDRYRLGLSNEEFSAPVEALTVVFVPPEFQPGIETFDERHAFVGPCLGDRAGQGDWQPPVDGQPVALVALGSFGYENQAAFYRSAVDALADLPWHLVLSLGGLVTPDDLGPLPANVTAAAWVPQLAVLAHASVFVSHAGMGSTMEALYHGIAPVVVPHTGEQALVADRLVELELGRSLTPEGLTPARLRTAVLGLYGDQGTRQRVRDLGATLSGRKAPALAADAIEARLASA